MTFLQRVLLAMACWLTASAVFAADLSDVIDRVKPSVVVVGTLDRLRSPAFEMRGTGFAVGDGLLVVTNAHVVEAATKDATAPVMAILAGRANENAAREAKLIAIDEAHDIAVLRIAGSPLPPLPIDPQMAVREGQLVAFTGFPLGGALGFSPVTHRGIVSSIAPVVLPSGHGGQLRSTAIRRLREGPFPIYQLDATAYPGNSGGPVFDAESGHVIGVMSMVLVKNARESALEKPSGISYAIPASHVATMITSLKK